MKRVIIPSLLYKYCKANRFSYQLLNGEIYFSQPAQLNDPTDLNPANTLEFLYNRRVSYLKRQIGNIKQFLADLGYDIDDMPFYQQVNEDIYQLRRELGMLADGDEPGEFLTEWAEEEMGKIRQRILEHRKRGAAKGYPEKFVKLDKYFSELWNLEQTWWGNDLEDNPLRVSTEEIGVLCLTADKKNYSMWTMYADGFRGICVGLDRKLIAEAVAGEGMKVEGPINVIYRKVTLKDILNNRFAYRETSRYMYKNPNWSAEKEVRFVWLDGFGSVKVPLPCVKEIIVGNRLDASSRQEIANTLVQRNRELAAEGDKLHVYQATGDAEGRVHIQIDAQLDSLVQRQKSRRHKAKPQNDVVKECPQTQLVDDDIPF